jgi:hypothetical protein
MKNIKYCNPIIETVAKGKINNEFKCVKRGHARRLSYDASP